MSESLDKISASPVPENIRDYAGMWVALRNREVVVAAKSLDDLVQAEGFEPTDVLHKVPDTESNYYEAA